VPDKDGITTLVRVLTLAAGLREQGLTIADRLDEIARNYGLTSPPSCRSGCPT